MSNGYAICFNEWIEDERIKSELRLLLKISSFTAENGFCYAGNEYFAKYFKCTTVNISRQVKKLKDLGYIEIKYKRNGSSITSRKIELKFNKNTVNKNVNRPLTKMLTAVNKNVKESITSINNNIYIEGTDKNIDNSKTKTVEQREDGSIFSNDQIATIERIVNAHPRKTRPALAQKAVVEYLQQRWERGGDDAVSESLDYLTTKTLAYAKAVEKWPSNQRQFIVGSYSWFLDRCFDEEPSDWERKEQSKTGRPDAPALKKFTITKKAN